MTPCRRLIWVLLIGVGARAGRHADRGHDQDTIAGACRPTTSARWPISLALVVFVGGTVLVLFREKLSKALEAALFWVVIGLVLVFGYTYRVELRAVSERVMAELIPGRAAQRTARTVEIVRGRAGDFQVAAQINGARIADGARHRRERGRADARSRQGRRACRSRC